MIAGVSTRALAESAWRAGYPCVTVDAFGDLDQRSRVRNISFHRDLGRRYSARVAAVVASRRLSGGAAAYVGNFENHPRAVRRLAEGRLLLGNPPDVLARARDPFLLAEVVATASACVPLTFRPGEAWRADAGRSWLRKPMHGGGGSGVRFWRPGERLEAHEVAQEYIDGMAASMVFLADGRQAVVLGLSRQLGRDGSGFRVPSSEVPPRRHPGRGPFHSPMVRRRRDGERTRNSSESRVASREFRGSLVTRERLGGLNEGVERLAREAATGTGEGEGEGEGERRAGPNRASVAPDHASKPRQGLGRSRPGPTIEVNAQAASATPEFRYAGSVHPLVPPSIVSPEDPAIPASLEAQAADLAAAVTAALGLRGVNGLDFVLRDGVPFVLELNPRYPASAELIERATGLSIFDAHAEACLGRLAVIRPRPATDSAQRETVWGKAIVYARRNVIAADTYSWLDDDGVRDIPFPGEHIPRGLPICTVFARGADHIDCCAGLAAMTQTIEAKLLDA